MKNDNSLQLNPFRKLNQIADWDFDYEVSSLEVKTKANLEDEDLILIEKGNAERILNLNCYWDTIEVSPDDNKSGKVGIKRANCLKRLVSKKKRRFQNEHFDLDLTYITKRVIAMGYPSQGCESMYRNSMVDLRNFLNLYHKEHKVFNLCLEKKRIYHKENFADHRVGLFPFSDHEPCPIKLMLEFCVDLCLYLIKNPYGIGAVHCKAGKGRTGVMIICYLIFSQLCNSSEEAIRHYANMRTLNKKGVTISSQIRYIKYFETFLSCNFTRPFVNMIPKIMKYYINPNTSNIIMNYMNDDSYFKFNNRFVLNKVRVGPFREKKKLKCKIYSLQNPDISFPNSESHIISFDDGYYYEIIFNSSMKIDYDISINFKGFRFKIHYWINLWYSTLELISKFIYRQNLLLDSGERFFEINAPSFVEMKEMVSGSPKQETQVDFFGIQNAKSPDSGSSYSFKTESSRSIANLISEIRHDCNLYEKISTVNDIASSVGKPTLDKNNMDVIFTAYELDKFSIAHKMHPDFKVILNYSLYD